MPSGRRPPPPPRPVRPVPSVDDARETAASASSDLTPPLQQAPVPSPPLPSVALLPPPLPPMGSPTSPPPPRARPHPKAQPSFTSVRGAPREMGALCTYVDRHADTSPLHRGPAGTSPTSASSSHSPQPSHPISPHRDPRSTYAALVDGPTPRRDHPPATSEPATPARDPVSGQTRPRAIPAPAGRTDRPSASVSWSAGGSGLDADRVEDGVPLGDVLGRRLRGIPASRARGACRPRRGSRTPRSRRVRCTRRTKLPRCR